MLSGAVKLQPRFGEGKKKPGKKHVIVVPKQLTGKLEGFPEETLPRCLGLPFWLCWMGWGRCRHWELEGGRSGEAAPHMVWGKLSLQGKQHLLRAPSAVLVPSACSWHCHGSQCFSAAPKEHRELLLKVQRC